MELPVSKPSGEEISAMKQEQRDTYSDNKQRIINHLRSRGIRPQAIAGIVGNIAVETGGSFDFSQKQTRTGSPTDPETLDYGGYGLFQFDDYSPGQGHRSWYKSYLEKNNKEDSAESQLDYFLDTVYASKGDPNYEYTEKLGSGDAGVLKAYLDTNENPSQISDAIVDRFEKAGIPHSDRRRRAAEETFAELQPSDRTDVDPDAQYIDQPGDIADTGESVSTEDESSPFEYVPFLRHFFAEGGAVPMERQMELFEDGGLKDEGGSIDPVSGNDVPPGSTMREVRDDIPAQLSEGEFVFPADVVRFIGLEKLMKMRQEAKMGLQIMEDMGQMGNSDEAIIPDDLPFDIYDLDMDMDEEYNTPQEFNQGGAVQQQGFTGIGGYRPPFQRQPVAGYTPTTIPQFQTTPMPGSYVPPQQAAVPTAQRPTGLPKFEGFTQKDVDNREYTNSETGEKRVFTFINGQPTIPIPPGFVPSSEYVKPETAKPVQEQVTTETTRVTEDDSEPPVSREETAIQRARVAAAKKMGITDQVGFSVSGAFGKYGPEDIGKFTPTGFIIGKNGVLLDPLTGMAREESGPTNILGAIVSALSKNEEPPEPAYSDAFFANLPDSAKDILGRSLGKDARDSRMETAAQRRRSFEDRLREKETIPRFMTDVEKEQGFDLGEIDVEKTSRASLRSQIARERQDEIRQTRNNIASVQAAARAEIASRDTGQQAAERSQREARERQEDRNQGGSGQTIQEKADSYTADRVAEAVATGDFSRGFAEGGLAAKKKPKAKKMKRGGLASKKQSSYVGYLIPHPNVATVGPNLEKVNERSNHGRRNAIRKEGCICHT